MLEKAKEQYTVQATRLLEEITALEQELEELQVGDSATTLSVADHKGLQRHKNDMDEDRYDLTTRMERFRALIDKREMQISDIKKAIEAEE